MIPVFREDEGETIMAGEFIVPGQIISGSGARMVTGEVLFADNILRTKEAITLAAGYGAAVEAELVLVGKSEDGASFNRLIYRFLTI